jgi:Ca2+-binding EF-hand superfamily protein
MAAFKFFDRNNTGSLCYEEIQAVMGFGGELDKKTIDKMIKEADTDGDGEISFEEFSKMMRSIGT